MDTLSLLSPTPPPLLHSSSSSPPPPPPPLKFSCCLQFLSLQLLPGVHSNRGRFTRRRHISMNTAAAESTSLGTPCGEMEVLRPVGEKDLLIVGPGVLGRLVAQTWMETYPDCKIWGQTVTTDHHDELLKLGITPIVRGSMFEKLPYVIFCAPPSKSADYTGEIRLASSKWNGEGAFLFTSSSAVFDCEDNGTCSEDSPIVSISRGPRTDVLLQAENATLEAGGCVLRLAGLYKSDRGPHTYWLGKGTMDSRPDHILNLIHYEDAASLAIAIMKQQHRSKIFVGCDNHPLSRQELMDLVNQSKKFDKIFEGFTGTDGPLGKKLNNSKTCSEIGWEPKYKSFASFLGL